MKPLLVIFQVREIPEVLDAINNLKIDKLWVKFFPQAEAYENARLWFLLPEHKEYTHFVICPDDLIPTQEAIDILTEDAKMIRVVSGWCNNTAGDTDDVYTDFSLQLPMMQTAKFEPYHFLPIAEIPHFDTIPVMHQGTALSFLPRDIIEAIPFGAQFPPDLTLSWDLYRHGITQYVDTRARMTHLRHPNILVGYRKREIKHERY